MVQQTISPTISLATTAAPAGLEAELVGRLGEVAGARVAVIGGGSLDVMCALIRAGCAAVSEIAVTERARLEAAEIAIVPRAASLAAVAQAVPVALRSLLPGGRIVLRDPTCQLARDFADLLRTSGFSKIRVTRGESGCFVTGERPIFGRLAA